MIFAIADRCIPSFFCLIASDRFDNRPDLLLRISVHFVDDFAKIFSPPPLPYFPDFSAFVDIFLLIAYVKGTPQTLSFLLHSI